MKINEVEKVLNTTRANIRFYEKEKLINPPRTGNGYRDYSEEDVARLKKILIFRKLGISVADIAKILDGDISLEEAIKRNVELLNAQMEELQGAIDVCNTITYNKETIQSFDEVKYWELIERREKQGSKFIDICRDYADFTLDYTGKRFGLISEDGKRLFGSWKEVIITILVVCIGRGLIGVVFFKQPFLGGFFYPFVVCLAASIILYPIKILSKKHPVMATVIMSTYAIAGVSFIAFVIVALVVMMIKDTFFM